MARIVSESTFVALLGYLNGRPYGEVSSGIPPLEASGQAEPLFEILANALRAKRLKKEDAAALAESPEFKVWYLAKFGPDVSAKAGSPLPHPS